MKAIPTVFVLFAALSFNVGASAHNGVPIERDECAHSVGGFLVHYSGYQPEVDKKGQYCHDLPRTGRALLVVDLVDARLRQGPVGVRVDGPGDDRAAGAVLLKPPQPNPSGVIEAEVRFERPGRYVVTLLGGEGADRMDQFELYVGTVNWPVFAFRAANYLIAGTVLTYVVLRSVRWFRHRWRRTR
jgi:hypothetical protein